MSKSLVLRESIDGIAVLTLNRPDKLDSMNSGMFGRAGVAALAVHPGMIRTELSRSLSEEELSSMARRRQENAKSAEISSRFKDVPRGAATSVWAATEPELKGKGPALSRGLESGRRDREAQQA